MLSPMKILIIVAILLILFGGRGKISNVMGDFAKGIKSFKQGMKEDDEDDRPTPPVSDRGATIDGTATRDKTEA